MGFNTQHYRDSRTHLNHSCSLPINSAFFMWPLSFSSLREKEVSEQGSSGGPCVYLMSAFCPPTQWIYSYSSCCITVSETCMQNLILYSQGISKSSSADDTKFLPFSCHIIWVISNSDFLCDGSEGTWIRHLPLSGHWTSDSLNRMMLWC